MEIGAPLPRPEPDEGIGPSDEEAILRICRGERDLFATLLRRYNQRVYRIARSVLRDDDEAEDVAQEAWVRAFTHLTELAERARFAAWLSRIAFREAVARARRGRRFSPLERDGRADAALEPPAAPGDPEVDAARGEEAAALRAAIDALPRAYRTVFVLRELEELSTAETARCLGLTPDGVKTRLHRARGLLRRELLKAAGRAGAGVFRFLGRRCDRLVARVLARLDALAGAA
jgi:RNA polymerase sigma-70 factor (ECF subfamily)